MTEWFLRGGVVMWPLLVLAVGVIALAVRAAVRIGDGERPSLGTILFWGGVALLVGALGTAVGIVVMSRSIAAAGGAVSAGLVWGGVGVALISLIFGILVFILSGCLWLGLTTWSRLAGDPTVSDA